MTAADATPAELGRVLAVGAALLAMSTAGVALGTDAATAVVCSLLLLVGLPHGALDIEQLKGAGRAGAAQLAGLFALYCGLAGAMFGLWQLSPVLAMALFLVTATIHFSEDWRAMGEPLLGGGMALSLLTAPALLHRAELRGIFAAVSGTAQGGGIAEFLLLLAPVAALVAIAGMFGLLRRDFRRQAIIAAVVLAAMILAPPIAGFALFFCVYHSPRHLRDSWNSLTLGRTRLLLIGGALTLAALGLTAALSVIEWRGAASASLTAATFMTFSILTVPHMLAPLLVRHRAKPSAQLAEASFCPGPNICGIASASKP